MPYEQTDTPSQEPVDPAADRTLVAAIAYEYWKLRGCPEGSPEEDWFRAEAALRAETTEAYPIAA